MDKSLELPKMDIVKKRTSVRTYRDEAVNKETRESISRYIDSLTNPFGAKVKFKILEIESLNSSKSLGTYGIIRGANSYIGASVDKSQLNLEALGYEFESLILHMASLDIGTCWLGGTFKRAEFAKAMDIGEDELFPAISPFGYPKDKKSLSDSLVRFIAKGDLRKPWKELFFNESFETSLEKNEAGIYEDLLESVRLAPSASNKQPWRIVKESENFHFYEFKTPGYSKNFGYDIQRIDMGIAAAHFKALADEREITGEFKVMENPLKNLAENIHYSFSWLGK